ncbi:uncharacterized protein BYT42DRAFT_568029 [Radiomyces spectabilis]|uniref:uncharacterized protein n=1 Tax=Radiomyces spectabilis TaxID=64574 RepID=UPI00221FB62A|nr:uncharacterized protein BYT42DRAFT_568029 [Radiomyces spectabilis]KAI8379216.1 hypothetical protein BYT42DRAFT_568029 [Radiomyces spectabilis]
MTDSIIKETRAMVSQYMCNLDPSHDMLHVDRVVRLAMHLANDCLTKGQRVDCEIVELAALCHDVGDRKYYKGDASGGELIRPFLMEHGLTHERASLVARIVDHVGFRKELAWNDDQDPQQDVEWRKNCTELHIVQDADKLDAIGAFGVLRCAAFSGAKNIPLFVPNLDPIKHMTKDEYEQQTAKGKGTAINHFHEKLFLLADMMRTSKGKAMAKERTEFMRLFVRRIEEEYHMEL